MVGCCNRHVAIGPVPIDFGVEGTVEVPTDTNVIILIFGGISVIKGSDVSFKVAK